MNLYSKYSDSLKNAADYAQFAVSPAADDEVMVIADRVSAGPACTAAEP